MSVIVGSARIDERGKAYNGKAGDQKSEVSTQNWYLHSKGWRVQRCVDPDKAEKIAWCMKAACDNNKIGYDQWQRLTLYNEAKKYGFDCSKVTTACETDCSALVRVCLAYAGIDTSNFRTTDEVKVLLATGMFVELKGDKYQKKSDYLKRGDVLCTKSQGHTVIVLSNGNKSAEDDDRISAYSLGERELKKGDVGADVKQLQELLISLNYSVGPDGADGDFGTNTQNAVKAFQKFLGEGTPTGVYDSKTHDALMVLVNNVEREDTNEETEIIEDETDAPINEEPASDHEFYVHVTGNTVNVRTQPNTKGQIIDIAKLNDELFYGGGTSADGWHNVIVNGISGWISGKYSELRKYAKDNDSADNAPDDIVEDDDRAIIDISQYQTITDINKLAKQVKLIIHRASIGDHKDTKFDKHAELINGAGIPLGVYHYVKASNEKEAKAEANVFFESANKYNPIFWCADMEYSGIGKKNARKVCTAFIAELKRLGVKKTGIYVGHHLYKNWDLDYSQVDFTWIPRYGTNKQNLAGEAGKWPAYTCTLHQYTSCGKLDGIKTRVDMNRITGKQLTFKELIKRK